MFSEENSTDTLCSSKGDKIQALMQTCLGAPEDQTSKQPSEKTEANSGELKSDKLEKDLFGKEDDPSYIKHETEEKVWENSVEDGQMQTDVAKEKHTLMKDVSEKWSENTQPLQIWPVLSEAGELAPLHVPGQLTTELEDEDQLETIHLPVSQSLRIDDLPDLEEIDTEDLAGIPHQQIFKPKIEVLSGESDGETPAENQSGAVSSFSHHGKSLFLISDCNKSPQFPHSSLLLDDLDVATHHPEFKSSQLVSVKHCLIEEID